MKQKYEKPKLLRVCRLESCRRMYDPKKVVRIYGSDKGYCTAQCYTKAMMKLKESKAEAEGQA